MNCKSRLVMLVALGVLCSLGMALAVAEPSGHTVALAGGHAHAGVGGIPAGDRIPGFVVLARHRFDPMLQRWLAEQSLKALPIRDGQLFYIIPVDTDPLKEQFQIRYIEEMLSRQPVEPDAG